MTFTEHFLIEIASGLICLFISHLALRRYRLERTGFSFLWGMGFLFAGLMDIVHAIAPLNSHPLAADWIPWTWAGSRIYLALTLLLALIVSNRYFDNGRRKYFVVLSIVGMTLLSLVDIPESIHSAMIPRPYDAGLLVLWSFVVIGFWMKRSARDQLPPYLFPFLTLGILVHALMMFSTTTFDYLFTVSHYLKVFEYLIWLVAAIHEVRVFEIKVTDNQFDLTRRELQRIARE